MGPNPPVISGYHDLVFIGRGGFASVYRARQLAFDRDVALKVIDQSSGDGRDADNFTRECRAIGSLSWHPHVVPVYDAGRTEDGSSYLAMELLPGGSLAGAVAGGPMAVADAVRHVHDVADALAAAHEVGVLHRDVKPANILLDRRGRARLADFGIARMAESGATTTGAVTGTIAYLAPEVLAGAKASTASDVYALGVTLATLLEGRNPYAQETDDSPFAVLNRVMSGDGPTLSRPIPPDLAGVMAACMARAPEDRPGSAATVRDALAALAPDSASMPTLRDPLPTPLPPADPTIPLSTPPTAGQDVRPVHPSPPPALRPQDDVTAALPRNPPPQGPPDLGDAPPPPGSVPPPPPRRRAGLVVVAIFVAIVGLLAAIAVGTTFWLGDDGDGTSSTTSTTTSTPQSTTSTTAGTTSIPPRPAATWEAAEAPTTAQQTLLDNADTMFTTADSCRPIDDLEADPFNVYPQGPDEASIECLYGDAATIVFSLFPDDAAMSSFFSGRLTSRGLARGSGTFGPTPPWQVDYADDPDRGTGSIFGAQRVADGGERSEIGFIRTGLRTYAYSFSVGTDFPTFYRWWSEIFGGPAPPG